MNGVRIFTVLIAILALNLNASFCLQEQNRTYGGVGRDSCSSFQQTRDGGYIIAGYTDSFGLGLDDVWLIKTDSAGTELWNRTFGGIYEDIGRSVRETSDGGYLILGGTSSYSKGNDSDIWLIKTDSSGKELWNRTFGGRNNDLGISVQETNHSEFVILGLTQFFGIDNTWLIKTDSSGNDLWNRTFSTSKANRGQSFQQTRDGGYIITGWVIGVYKEDAFLIKTDSVGNEQWNKTFEGLVNSNGNGIVETDDGGYIITGRSSSRSDLRLGNLNKQTASNDDALLIKIDSSGNELWNKTLGGQENDYGTAIFAVRDGGYVISGYTESYGAGSSDAWLIKINSSGLEQFNKTFGGQGVDRSYSIVETVDDRYAIAGYTESFGSGNGDIWLIWY